jgi:hypothetical protein
LGKAAALARRRRAEQAAGRLGAQLAAAVGTLGDRAAVRFRAHAVAASRATHPDTVVPDGDLPTPHVPADGLFDSKVWDAALVAASGFLTDHIVAELAEMGVEAEPGSLLVETLVADGVAGLESYGDDMRGHMGRTLAHASATALAIDTAADLLRSGPFSTRVAELVAQSGVFAAGNGAADTGATAAGVATRRHWASVGDRRVRPTHRAADGQEVGMNEPFIVGGYQLAYPGDPAGPASETISCRCVAVYLSRGA